MPPNYEYPDEHEYHPEEEELPYIPVEEETYPEPEYPEPEPDPYPNPVQDEYHTYYSIEELMEAYPADEYYKVVYVPIPGP